MGNNGRIKVTIPVDVKEKISLHAKHSGVSLKYFMESIISIYLDDLEKNPRSLNAEALYIISTTDETVKLDVDIIYGLKKRIITYCKNNDVTERILIFCSIKYFYKNNS